MVQPLPVRYKVQNSFKNGPKHLRGLVSSGQPFTLSLSGTTVEILSVLGGKYLRPIQRQTLLAALVEHLTVIEPLVGDQGPLLGGDVIGAILGIIQFGLMTPDSWVMCRIPETPGSMSPDILAWGPNEGTWLLELKSSSPLSGEFGYGDSIDLCKNRIYPNVNKGFHQLSAWSAKANCNEALCCTVLGDATLLTRGDLISPKDPKCKVGCVRQCISTNGNASLNGVLWRKRRTLPASAQATKNLVSSLTVLQGAVWANSPTAATSAIASLGQRLAALDIDPQAAAAVLQGALTESRTLTTRLSRRIAVDEFLDSQAVGLAKADVKSLRTAVEQGMGEFPDPVDFRAESPWAESEQRVSALGTDFTGRSVGSSLRFTPALDSLERHLASTEAPSLQEVANSVLLSTLNQIRPDFPDPLHLVPVEVRLADAGGERSWRVGFEAPLGLTVQTPLRLLLSPTGWAASDGRIRVHINEQ